VLQTLNGHKDEVTSIAITTYEDNILVIASGSQDKTIKLWFNTVPLYTLREHEGVIQEVMIKRLSYGVFLPVNHHVFFLYLKKMSFRLLLAQMGTC